MVKLKAVITLCIVLAVSLTVGVSYAVWAKTVADTNYGIGTGEPTVITFTNNDFVEKGKKLVPVGAVTDQNVSVTAHTATFSISKNEGSLANSVIFSTLVTDDDGVDLSQYFVVTINKGQTPVVGAEVLTTTKTSYNLRIEFKDSAEEMPKETRDLLKNKSLLLKVIAEADFAE